MLEDTGGVAAPRGCCTVGLVDGSNTGSVNVMRASPCSVSILQRLPPVNCPCTSVLSTVGVSAS